MLHVPRKYFEDCKVLHNYSKNHVAQRPFKYKQALSSGNKHGKTVKFENAIEEENIIKSHDAPMQIKKKGKGHNNKSKNNQINADPSEDERNYGLDRLNLVKLHRNQEVTPNDSSHKVGKSRGRKIKITVLNVNVTFYLIL